MGFQRVYTTERLSLSPSRTEKAQHLEGRDKLLFSCVFFFFLISFFVVVLVFCFCGRI